jgi:ATP dependent DNA ligase-like protein
MDASFDKKKFKCKFDYCIGKAADLGDPKLQNKAQDYKRRLSAAMRAVSGEDIGRVPAGKGTFVSRKYDGEFAYVVFDGTNAISLHPSGTVRSGLPCLEEAAKGLKKAKVKSCILAAEYYLLDTAAESRSLEQVLGVLRNPGSKKELDRLALAVFDVVEVDGKAVNATTAFRDLDKWFGKGKNVHPVEHKSATKSETIMETYVDWVVGEGAEGIVVRNDKGAYYKVKLRHNLDVAVIGFSEGTENRKGMLHDLLVAVVRPDGTFQELTRVGGGFSESGRKELLKDLQKRVVPSEYVAVNNDYVAYDMIKPGPVIEISCLDMIAERTKGGPVNRMVLEWTGKKYAALSRMPLVSVISPQFVRLRDDKEAGIEETSISQVTDQVKVSDATKPAQNTGKLNPSKLIERTVYTKVMKENTMVRKLLLWKTNKEDTPDFPAYVVYLTDFSPNRKTPLERDIKVASTEKIARNLFKEMADKNFVGGWEKVS